MSFTVCAGIFTYSLRSHNVENTVNIKSIENIFSFYIFCTSLLITDSLSRMEPLDKIGTFAINSANDSTNISSQIFGATIHPAFWTGYIPHKTVDFKILSNRNFLMIFALILNFWNLSWNHKHDFFKGSHFVDFR